MNINAILLVIFTSVIVVIVGYICFTKTLEDPIHKNERLAEKLFSVETLPDRRVVMMTIYKHAGLDDYIKETTESINDPCSTFRIHESKDETLGREYTAYVGAAVAFTKDKPSVQCYYNCQRLENGGAFLNELYKCLQEHINYISERACRHPLLTALTKRELKKHISVVIDIKTIGCIPDWTDGRRTAINNRMFTDLVRDMCTKEIRYSIFSNEDAVLDLLEIIREERYRDGAESSFIKKFERAIEDYENGDGK